MKVRDSISEGRTALVYCKWTELERLDDGEFLFSVGVDHPEYNEDMVYYTPVFAPDHDEAAFILYGEGMMLSPGCYAKEYFFDKFER